MRSEKNHYMASNGSKNKLIVLGVILGVCILIFVITRLWSVLHSSTPSTEPQKDITFSNGNLQIDDISYKLQGYPDRVKIHGDYLLIIQPNLIKTTIYSISKQKKLVEEKKIIFDYDGKYMLSYANDRTIYFNNLSLQVSCIDGYIVSEEKVLCIVPKKDDNLDNKLVIFNPVNQWRFQDIYSSNYTLHSIAVINDIVYLGGYTLNDQKPVLIINGKPYPIQDRADQVYAMNNKLYFASFNSSFNNNTESYSEILTTKAGTSTKVVEKGKVVFYESE